MDPEMYEHPLTICPPTHVPAQRSTVAPDRLHRASDVPFRVAEPKQVTDGGDG